MRKTGIFNDAWERLRESGGYGNPFFPSGSFRVRQPPVRTTFKTLCLRNLVAILQCLLHFPCHNNNPMLRAQGSCTWSPTMARGTTLMPEHGDLCSWHQRSASVHTARITLYAGMPRAKSCLGRWQYDLPRLSHRKSEPVIC